MPRLKNKNWEKFVVAYVSKETYLSGLYSYAKAYGYKLTSKKEVDVCKSNAYRLLTYPAIQDRIKELMERTGFDDASVDLEHLKMLRQDIDFKSKMAAIKEYNSLKKRTTPNAPTINQNIISYEQHIINNTYGTARVVEPLPKDEKELQRVQESLPEDQHEVIGANQIQAQSGSGDIRESNSGAGEAEEAYPGFSS